jgi:glycosyltransferase involved in cell wall biosynthesis
VIIAIDATSIGSHLGGDETLVRGLLSGLVCAARLRDTVIVLAADGATLPADVESAPGFTVERVARRSGPAHFALVLPRWLAGLVERGLRPDVVVTNTHAPLRSPAPVALVVPDLSFLHLANAYPRGTRLRLRLLVGRQVRSAGAVLTISEFCRGDLIDSYRLPPPKVSVVPLTIEPPGPVPAAVRAALRERGVREPYVLYLGNLHPRKNVPRAIRAFLHLRRTTQELAAHQFVVAGRRWFGGTDEQAAAAEAPGDAVLFLDRVEDDEREALLRDAQALVYLSTFEGFGLPPIEAMARDTPVLASTATAIPEVCGDAALLVDPLDGHAVEEGLRRILLEVPLREHLIHAGRLRVAHYSVQATGTALRSALSPFGDRARHAGAR